MGRRVRCLRRGGRDVADSRGDGPDRSRRRWPSVDDLEGVVGRRVRSDADQRCHGERRDELASPKTLGGRAPRAGHVRPGPVGDAHHDGVHRAMSGDLHASLRAPARPYAPARADSPNMPPCPGPDQPPCMHIPGIDRRHATAVGTLTAGDCCPLASGLLPSGIDMASFRPVADPEGGASLTVTKVRSTTRGHPRPPA